MRLSPPSLGSSVKIQAGTLAFGNDKNLWIRKKRNDKNTYWSSFAELNLELGIPRNEEGTYNYLQIEWEIPDFGILSLSYINSGRITFQSFANNNDELLFLNVPLIRASSNKRRINAFKDIIFDFIDDLRLIPDIDLQLITTMSQELNKLFNVFLNGFYDISENYLDKNDYDFQASIDFPLKRTFRPNSDDLFVLNITNEEQEPTPTPQSETPEAEKGLPSIDPATWFGKFEVGDKVKVRWDYSNDLGLEKTKGFSKVDYFSSENNYSVVKVIISSDSMRPENITGKLYKLNTGQFWEGKDLELITEQEQPTPTPQPDEFKPIWRVKTEQEFIDEFGEKWKNEVGWNVAGAMNYLFAKSVTNPTFNGENFTPRSFVTSRELGIDSGNDNTWYLRQQMFKKIENDEQESSPMIGKLFLKQNYDTYLQISENEDRLVLNSDEFQYIKPWGIYDDKFFQFEDTYNLRTYGIYCKILLNYKTGIDIYFKNEKNNKIFSSYNITSESVFLNAIGDIRRFAGFSPFERELDLIALLLSEGIWRNRSIVCDFVSGLPKPKFQVGDKVKRVIGSSILTIKTITAFDDQRQEWDYDLLTEGGVEVSQFESELELVSTEIPTTSECDVDVNLIDSQYVGQFYQQNKNRIEALNPNISCLFLEALLSLSNYEKCGDGVEIPMPQPKKEVKEDLLSQIRNL